MFETARGEHWAPEADVGDVQSPPFSMLTICSMNFPMASVAVCRCLGCNDAMRRSADTVAEVSWSGRDQSETSNQPYFNSLVHGERTIPSQTVVEVDVQYVA